jgi:succinate-semialdehyde dehydrogenase/glutarate-semialdehyde dehydrogenase
LLDNLARFRRAPNPVNFCRSAAEIISTIPQPAKEVGRAPLVSPAEVAEAVQRARAAQLRLGQTHVSRTRPLHHARAPNRARRDGPDRRSDFAETGKPVAEAISMEVVTTLDLMQYFARQTAKLLRPQKIDIGQYGLMGRSSRLIYKPLGVVGIISPWNFPGPLRWTKW